MRTSLSCRCALTPNQKTYVSALKNPKYDIVVVSGPAGTGKTKLCTDVGLEMMRAKQYGKLIITRPVVMSTDQNLGFMPGGLKDKMLPWMMPVYDSVSETTPAQKLEENGKLEIVPFAFMRGRTFKNSWIICDETQNCTKDQVLMLLTRIGTGSKIVITGDPTQCDIFNSGFRQLLNHITNSENSYIAEHIALVNLGSEDIMRHHLIPHIIDMYDKK